MNIFNSDCFDALPLIKEDSIDLVCVDLPYSQTSLSWDVAIDLDKMWIELKRICKKRCWYIFFTTTKFGFTIIKSNPKWFRYDLIWIKNKKVGFLNANIMPLRSHEMIYLMGDPKGTRKTYNPQKIKKDKPYTDKRNGEINRSVYRKEGIKYKINKQDNGGMYHPTSLLTFNNEPKPIHKTQKPLELCEWLIKTYSNEGDMVLDFTMGSGTTGVACKNTKRRFIGIEMDKDIYEIAKQRLN